MTARRHQHGVGLIEVMVAVVILSIGLLGIAVLQMRSLRNNQSAFQRSMAVVQVHAIADALRADRTTAVNGDFDLATGDAAPEDPVTFSQIALADWRSDLIEVLGPDATGSVDCNGSLCTIAVVWNDERGSEGDADFTIQTELQL